jgi:predicted esterase
MSTFADFTRPVLVCALMALLAAWPALAQDSSLTEAQEVFTKWQRAYHAQDWEQAIELGLTLNKLVPRNRTHRYNLACAYALNGDADKAVNWLRKAAAAGFREATLLETDSDLASLRGRAEYKDALERVRKNRDDRLIRLRRGFEQHPPLIYPPSGDDKERPSPLIIALHGYGATAQSVAAKWRTTARQAGAILVAPSAIQPVEGSVGFSWPNPEDADVLIEMTLEHIRQQYKIDDKRIILTGFSQGGFISHALGVRHPERFVGVIPMGGGYWPHVDAPPEVNDKHVPRYYFMVGEYDDALAENRKAVADFAAAGYMVQLRIYPGVGHRFPISREEELRKALAFVLSR